MREEDAVGAEEAEPGVGAAAALGFLAALAGMPKLSSAETPPEKSSDCLPVRTIAESGVMTRMPLVCMSIVASAFQ